MTHFSGIACSLCKNIRSNFSLGSYHFLQGEGHLLCDIFNVFRSILSQFISDIFTNMLVKSHHKGDQFIQLESFFFSMQ